MTSAPPRPTVLVLEDNRPLAENVAELFEEEGAEVLACWDPAKARECVRSATFDLAIVDLHLGHREAGVGLLPILRETAPDAHIIVITGQGSLDTAVEAVRHGVFAYVLKPFDAGDLVSLGKRALAAAALRRERQALVRELALSESLYRGVVETVDSLILGLDEDDVIRFANRHAGQVFGRETGALLGQRFLAVGSIAEDADELAVSFRRGAAGGDAPAPRVRVRAVDGRIATVRWTFTVLADRDGPHAPALLAVGRDETRRTELERRAAETEALAAIATLTAGLAHEIRNPLNAAQLQLELLFRSAGKLADEAISSRIAERVAIVRAELGRLSSMLDDFLSLAHPSQVEAAPFDVVALVQEVIRLDAPAASGEGVQLGLAPPAAPASVAGDRNRIKQVLVNLIRNALEAMHDTGGGRITIRFRDLDAGMLEIAVEDTGPGLQGGAGDLVFRPFFTTKEAGTGLGLAIVKKIVELHGGSVRVEAREGARGTIAAFTLPRAQP